MHIGYVLKKFPRASETFILNEILELQRQGVDVTVFSLNRPDDGVYHAGLAELKRPVIYLPARKGADGWLAVLRQQRAWVREHAPVLLELLDGLLAAERPDTFPLLGWALDLALLCREHGVQHLHAHFATVAAHAARGCSRLAGLPFSVTCHAKDIYRTGIVPAQFQDLLRAAAFVVTVCEANKRWIETELQGDADLDVRVLYNGVDTKSFAPRARGAESAPTVVAVGRLVEKKGFHVLIDALAALRQSGAEPRCELIGDGEERQALAARAASRGLQHLEFAGMRTHEEVRAALHRATMLVLPCIVGQDGNRDALPTVLLEALASGLPVVSTPIGGVEEIVDGGEAGVLVPENDAAALCAAMRRLLDDPAERARLSTAGRRRAEQVFDLARNVGVLAGWYEDSIARRLGVAEAAR